MSTTVPLELFFHGLGVGGWQLVYFMKEEGGIRQRETRARSGREELERDVVMVDQVLGVHVVQLSSPAGVDNADAVVVSACSGASVLSRGAGRPVPCHEPAHCTTMHPLQCRPDLWATTYDLLYAYVLTHPPPKATPRPPCACVRVCVERRALFVWR